MGREPLPGPKSGLLSNTRKLIVWGDTHTEKAKDFIERGIRVESSRVREPRRTTLPHGLLAVSGFMVVGLVSVLSLADHLACRHIWSDSGSFQVVHVPLSQDGFQNEGFWDVGWSYGLASPPSFWPSRILLVCGSLLAAACQVSVLIGQDLLL